MREIFIAAGTSAWESFLGPEFVAGLNPTNRWAEAIEDPDQAVFVAINKAIPNGSAADPPVPSEPPTGFIVLRLSGDEDATPQTGEVDSFYTHPDAWGQGQGRALMQVGLEWLTNRGYTSVTLWTEERNERPRNFYTNNGWELDGTIRERSLRGVDLRELRYRRSLSKNL